MYSCFLTNRLWFVMGKHLNGVQSLLWFLGFALFPKMTRSIQIKEKVCITTTSNILCNEGAFPFGHSFHQ